MLRLSFRPHPSSLCTALVLFISVATQKDGFSSSAMGPPATAPLALSEHRGRAPYRLYTHNDEHLVPVIVIEHEVGCQPPHRSRALQALTRHQQATNRCLESHVEFRASTTL
ncbi:hypothetical protein NDU88_000366 [Pleurodeles waltl]|uniref:Secreted protein n=1 Tax=Pleurodeles waltl TaxID=8319 RepID=A0AAV7S7B5_PLEWA|nr:hypothetical protein NDU88_000366 [Pleurodeles waltl]